MLNKRGKKLKKRLKINPKACNMNIGFFSVLLLTAFIINNPLFAISAIITIALHEMGHIYAAKLIGVNFSEFTLSVFGAALRPENTLFSYADEIFVCIGGPFINFITFTLLIPLFFITSSSFILYVALSSLMLGALNLIPVKDMDGGRILLALLCLILSPSRAHKILTAISFFSIVILWFFSVYLMLIASFGLSSFVFSLTLFSKIFLAESVK